MTYKHTATNAMKTGEFCKKMLLVIILLTIVLPQTYCFSQGRHLSNKAFQSAIRATVYLENTFAKSGLDPNKQDTLVGTGFLISDHGKVYLVTAKHIIQNKLLHRATTDSLIIITSPEPEGKGFKFPGFIDANARTKGYMLSNDADDIAIISFQKNAYKSIYDMLKRKGSTPLPLSAFYNGNTIKKRDTVSHVGEVCYKWQDIMARRRGGFTGTVNQYDIHSKSFLIASDIFRGNDGAPAFINDKVVGMVTKGLLSSNMPAVSLKSYGYSKKGTVIKSSVILSLLKQLQTVENQSNFN